MGLNGIVLCSFAILAVFAVTHAMPNKESHQQLLQKRFKSEFSNFIHKKKQIAAAVPKSRALQVADKKRSGGSDCDKVFVSLKKLMNTLPAIMTEDEIHAAFVDLETEGLDILNPSDQREIACTIADYSYEDMIEEMTAAYPGASTEELEMAYSELMDAYTSMVDIMQYMVEMLEMVGMQNSPEYRAAKAYMDFYHTLEEVGFTTVHIHGKRLV
jgi:hypothetical protein